MLTVPQLGIGPKAESHQREMCPKHGVAHGVCVDPIKAEVPPHHEPNAAHYGLEPCDIPNCAWCEVEVDESARSKGKDDSLDYYRQPVTERTTNSVAPNRFDPYEALDAISTVADRQFPSGSHSAEVLRVHLKALRAYITGMER